MVDTKVRNFKGKDMVLEVCVTRKNYTKEGREIRLIWTNKKPRVKRNIGTMSN